MLYSFYIDIFIYIDTSSANSRARPKNPPNRQAILPKYHVIRGNAAKTTTPRGDRQQNSGKQK
jgi:hypothetical protein